MAEPLELTTEQWEFVYQLILLGIGAGITVILVPIFTNRYQNKQIEINRIREDLKLELQTQHFLVDKVSRFLSSGYARFAEQDIVLNEKKPVVTHQDLLNFFENGSAVSSLMKLYYENTDVFEVWMTRREITVKMILYLIKSEEQERDDILNSILKLTDIELDLEEAKKMIQNQGYKAFTEQLVINSPNLLEEIMNTRPKIY